MVFPALLILGVAAGTLTTVAGMGGGLLLLLALSVIGSPAQALAATTPALLLGNIHRCAIHFREVDRRIATAFTLGALPGSLLGGALVTQLPAGVLRALLLLSTAIAVARALKLWSFRPPATVLTPAGFVIGATSATSGGAGLLVSPLLLSSGLTGVTYVATTAAVATGMNMGRLVSYGASGLMTRSLLASAAVLAAAILAGNLLGERMRPWLGAKQAARMEIGVLVACVVLALAGAA